MFNSISGSCFFQAAMLRMCFGLVFVGLAVAAHTAQSEESSLASDLEILTIQPVRPDADWLRPYRISMSFALTRSMDSAPIGARLSHTPRLHPVANPRKEIAWPTNARWQIARDSGRVSLSPLLRFESAGERIEVKPRRNSFQIVWRKDFY
ncbi:MAG: hypothetical protein Q7T29_03005 [Gallionella sp.]|nr:hypothetical protein [Gallionella sp.]